MHIEGLFLKSAYHKLWAEAREHLMQKNKWFMLPSAEGHCSKGNMLDARMHKVLNILTLKLRRSAGHRDCSEYWIIFYYVGTSWSDTYPRRTFHEKWQVSMIWWFKISVSRNRWSGIYGLVAGNLSCSSTLGRPW